MGRFDNVNLKKVEMSPSWDFENDKTITGILLSVESNVGPNSSNVYTLDTENGNIAVWGSTIIDTRLKNVNVGDVVKINFLGKVKSEKRKGSSYNNFEVYHGTLNQPFKDISKQMDSKSLDEISDFDFDVK